MFVPYCMPGWLQHPKYGTGSNSKSWAALVTCVGDGLSRRWLTMRGPQVGIVDAVNPGDVVEFGVTRKKNGAVVSTWLRYLSVEQVTPDGVFGDWSQHPPSAGQKPRTITGRTSGAAPAPDLQNLPAPSMSSDTRRSVEGIRRAFSPLASQETEPTRTVMCRTCFVPGEIDAWGLAADCPVCGTRRGLRAKGEP